MPKADEILIPTSVQEAFASPQRELWAEAMNVELTQLSKNQTWSLREAPPGAKVIPSMWVYTIKRDADGRVARFKARLVAKGYKQREGIDYNETFAPTSKVATMRAMLAIVAKEDLELRHLDVTTAFLNGDLEETIYMQQPPGFEEGGDNTSCLLHKSLYGLRQAPRAWHLKLKSTLEGMGFEASTADPGFYVLRTKAGEKIYLLVYVDDFLLAAKSNKHLDALEAKLKAAFELRNLGEAKFFLGMEIKRDRRAHTITISQPHMIADLLSQYNMKDCKPRAVPLSTSDSLTAATTEEELLDTTQFPYSSLVGSLLYLSNSTRPDIVHAVNKLARFMAAPTEQHWLAAKGVLRYLAGTPNLGITYGGNHKAYPTGYCDADYAGCADTRRSTTGFTFLCFGGAVSWNSRLQPTVAMSTAESEYMAASAAVKEALWLLSLFTSFGYKPSPVRIKCDNQACLSLVEHPISSNRSKHIDVHYHFARERNMRGEVQFEFCPTADMVADCFTKALPPAKFEFCRERLGMHI